MTAWSISSSITVTIGGGEASLAPKLGNNPFNILRSCQSLQCIARVLAFLQMRRYIRVASCLFDRSRLFMLTAKCHAVRLKTSVTRAYKTVGLNCITSRSDAEPNNQPLNQCRLYVSAYTCCVLRRIAVSYYSMRSDNKSITTDMRHVLLFTATPRFTCNYRAGAGAQ